MMTLMDENERLSAKSVQTDGCDRVNDTEFVRELYDAILNAGCLGEVPVRFEDSKDEIPGERWPSKSWEWTVLGDRVFWFLQICDHRQPIQGRLYQLDAMHNFFPWARELGMTTSQRIAEFVGVLVTAMDAQELGQHEAAANPDWAQRGEFFNPWAGRLVFHDPSYDAQPVMAKNQFLELLYDCLRARQHENRVPWRKVNPRLPSRDRLHPRQPHFQDTWHWKLQGSREHWWLEIVDPRFPGAEYPYRIAQDDPAFFETAQNLHLVDDRETFIEVGLITPMEEQDLGQVQAKAAYDQGATSDNPPWVHTEDHG